MKIGELAAKSGLNPKTIRYYEAEGLLPLPSRTLSGYRSYQQEDTDRLDFVLKAKRLGLSLEEIKSILQLHDRKEPTCLHVRSLLDDKLAHVDRALADLQIFRKEVALLRDKAGVQVDCRPEGGRICGIIEGSGPLTSGPPLSLIDPAPVRRR